MLAPPRLSGALCRSRSAARSAQCEQSTEFALWASSGAADLCQHHYEGEEMFAFRCVPVKRLHGRWFSSSAATWGGCVSTYYELWDHRHKLMYSEYEVRKIMRRLENLKRSHGAGSGRRLLTWAITAEHAELFIWKGSSAIEIASREGAHDEWRRCSWKILRRLGDICLCGDGAPDLHATTKYFREILAVLDNGRRGHRKKCP